MPCNISSDILCCSFTWVFSQWMHHYCYYPSPVDFGSFCLLVRFKHGIPENALNSVSFSWTLGPQYEARNSFHLFPWCQLKGWNFHHPAFSLLNVSAGIRWILREGLIFGSALNQLPNHIPFSMLLQASGCSARAAFILYLLKCFIHLHMQRPHQCPK